MKPKNPPPEILRPHPGWFLVLDGPLALLAAFVIIPSLGSRFTKIAPFATKSLLKWTFFAALVVHAAEGATAWSIAGKKGLNQRGWALQTALVGFPSLRLLIEQNPENQDYSAEYRPN